MNWIWNEQFLTELEWIRLNWIDLNKTELKLNFKFNGIEINLKCDWNEFKWVETEMSWRSLPWQLDFGNMATHRTDTGLKVIFV